MTGEFGQSPHPFAAEAVRDPLSVTEAVLDARQRPMSERLELALSWNEVSVELRSGMAKVTGHAGS
ncbi:MAG: hypothetical protein WBQ21_00940 [Solirubrobacteraceae bacterium]